MKAQVTFGTPDWHAQGDPNDPEAIVTVDMFYKLKGFGPLANKAGQIKGYML